MSSSISHNDSALWHLTNIISAIESLVEVFEKQTLSTGIQSLYDLKNIKNKGTFILKANQDSSKVLSLELLRDDDTVVIESIEYLLDLRSKLLMTEVSIYSI